ncbi:MAG: cupredoxin domain-containing protein [Candidatus Limnocylindria bacterium]
MAAGARHRLSRSHRGRHGGFELAFRRWALPALVTALVLAACAPSGGASADGDVRSVEVRMTDELRFEPAEITVSAAETVRFEVTNDGQAVHEFLIGDEAAQGEFAEEMAEGGMHTETDAGVTVQPGETETFEYTFDAPGELLAGCHEPGHYEAGMVASISVGE